MHCTGLQQEQQGGGDLITIAADAQTTVILTILNDQQQPRTAQEVGSMAADEFCMLYTVSFNHSLYMPLSCPYHLLTLPLSCPS